MNDHMDDPPLSLEPLRIALSTDAKGHAYHATLIASILRRTAHPVHVRCWCRGFAPESFEVGPLKVEFIPTDEEVTGKFPSYVGPAVFDRLRVIRDATDWDKCLIMDYDQLALCDLAPLFELDLGDNLLAAKMQGPKVNMAYAMETWIKRPLPEGWEHVADYPYFSMGPLLNLKAMREAGTWETLLAAHAAFGVDEQLSLTAATEGRTMGFERKWNLFPKSDLKEDEIPAGVVHWLGWPKPWHPGAKVWRPDIWESEASSWEHLRMGLWRKPHAIEIEPGDYQGVKALAQRGWKVTALQYPMGGVGSLALQPAFPDVVIREGNARDFQRELAAQDCDCVRFGSWVDAGDWLKGCAHPPEHLTLRGAVECEDLQILVELGYESEARVVLREWALGGPLPRVLDYREFDPTVPLSAVEEIHLRRQPNSPVEGDPFSARAERAARHVKLNARKVGLLVIATANYRKFVIPLVRSIRRNFLPEDEVTIFLFTDGDFSNSADLRVIPIEHSPWPGMVMRRHALLREHAAEFADMDYLFYLDADMRVVSKVGDEILGDLVAVVHPGFHDQPRSKFTYEKRPESTACIADHEGSRYFVGAFQGGRRETFLEAVRVMAEKIDQDDANGVMARWHDESHWNRYLIDRPPGVMLPPDYACYPDSRGAGFSPKISIVIKDDATIRKEG
ncbi:MAG: glycosyltransferase [Luteolibacter sp.]